MQRVDAQSAPSEIKKEKGAIGKLSERINQFIDELKGKNLTPEQQGIYDVFTRKEKIYKIQDLNDVGEYVKLSQGKRNYGTKHILIKHFGTNISPVTSDEILQIGDIIRTGKVSFDNDGRIYTLDGKDGSQLRLVVKKDKQGDNTVFTFYAKNRKAPMRATEGTSDLQEAFQKAESSATSSIASTGQEVKSADALSDAEPKNTTKENPWGLWPALQWYGYRSEQASCPLPGLHRRDQKPEAARPFLGNHSD